MDRRKSLKISLPGAIGGLDQNSINEGKTRDAPKNRNALS
jgi:hypothetical protein